MRYFIIADTNGQGYVFECEDVQYASTGWIKFVNPNNFIVASISPGFSGYYREITKEDFEEGEDTDD